MAVLKHLSSWSRKVVAARGILAVVCLGVIGGCGPFGPKPTSVEVPLEYKPRTDDTAPSVSSPAIRQIKLYVLPTEDKRDEADRGVIGMNEEDSNAKLPVHGTGGKVTELCNKALMGQLRDAGIPVTKDMPGDQFMQLQTDVVKFFVHESGNYKAEVAIIYRLLDAKGSKIYENQFTGMGQNYGQSKSPENYQETYSDALKRANIKLISDASFIAALSGTPQ